MSLTDRQLKFCREYVKTLNATQSAINAGYSKNTAGETGYENLRKPQIAEEIQRILKDEIDADYLDANKILSEIASIGFGTTDDFESKTSDRLKALELLCRYNNLFEKEKKTEAEAKQITVNIVK